MTDSDFREMAREREEFAKSLSDKEIWKSVTKSTIKLVGDPTFKADVLLSSIPDIGIIFGQLKNANKTGEIEDQVFRLRFRVHRKRGCADLPLSQSVIITIIVRKITGFRFGG